MVDAQQLAGALEAKGFKVKTRPGGSYQAQCPCHDDKQASLSFTDRDGTLLVKCFSETCDVSAMGITPLLSKLDILGHSDGVTRHIYTTEKGVPVFRVVRKVLEDGKKEIYQDRLDAKGQVVPPAPGKSAMDGVDRPLYRLPLVVKAIRAKEPIYIVEGEKCAERLIKEGVCATTQAGGSSAKWDPRWSDKFNGIEVIIWADNDSAGEARAEHVAESLAPFAASVTIVKSATDGKGDDCVEHFDAGHTLEDVIVVRKVEEVPAIPFTWMHEVIAQPIEWLVDGLIPRGEITLVEGEPGCGKTMFMLSIAASLSRGHSPLPLGGMSGEPMRVWYISTEDRADVLIKPRLEKMGANFQNIMVTDSWEGCFDEDGMALFKQMLRRYKPHLVVGDAFLDLVLPAVSGDIPKEVKPILRGVRRAVVEHGGVFAAIRHVTKSSAKSGSASMSDGYGGSHYSQAARAQLRVVPGQMSGTATVIQVKNNYQQRAHPFSISLSGGLEEMFLDPSESDITLPSHEKAKILVVERLMQGPCRSDDLKAMLEGKGVYGGLIWDLRENGLIDVKVSKDSSGAWWWELKEPDF